MLLTAGDCLKECGAKPFTMELGHIGAFKALIDELSAADWQKEEIRQLVEEKNYTALSDLLGELPASPAARALDQLPRLFGGADVFGQAATLSQSAAFQAALRELEQLYRQLIQADPAAEVLVDFGLVNQAEYYTGIVFRGYLPGIGQPVLSGGRYDRAAKRFRAAKTGHRICHSSGRGGRIPAKNAAATTLIPHRPGLLAAGAGSARIFFFTAAAKSGSAVRKQFGGF